MVYLKKTILLNSNMPNNSENSKSFLNGAVLLDRLTSDKDSSGRFQVEDSRGRVAVFLSGVPTTHIEYAEFNNPGIKRGFHYHNELLKRIYICKGVLDFAAMGAGGNIQIDFRVFQGDLLTISPRIAHAFLSQEEAVLVAALSGNAHPFEDRTRFPYLTFSSQL